MSDSPNILFILPDQLRPDYLGCYGADFLKTPAIDALAARGVVYEQVVSPAPICVPARASMLTGQDALTTGVLSNLAWLRPDRAKMGVASWPEALAEVGYRSCAIGKMHFYPWDVSEGFDERVIAEDKRHIHIEDDYSASLVAAGFRREHGAAQRGYRENFGASLNDLPDELHPDRWVADQAAAWIARARDDRPWALMVGFPGPHCPYDPPESALASIDPTKLPTPRPRTDESDARRSAFIASYKRPWADLDYSTFKDEDARRVRWHYAALVERLDQDVARVLGAVDGRRNARPTVVIFASDHGDYLGDYGLVGKTYFHEPSIRVPFIVADPRAPIGGRRDAGLRSLLDLFPTILELGGAPERSGQAGGVALSSPSEPTRIVCGATTIGLVARGQRWKLARYADGRASLFDLATDPEEATDRIGDPAAALEREALDRALATASLTAASAGHADKLTPDAQATPPHPFYRRGWSRPYPNGL